MNHYLYQGVPNDRDYISPYHRWWKEHYEEVLSPSIDRAQCLAVARVLAPAFVRPDDYPNLSFTPDLDRCGLSPAAVANVRFFTAIQDFKVNIYKNGRNPFDYYQHHPELFTPQEIAQKPLLALGLIEYLGAQGSQGDKRRKWMVRAAEYLVQTYDGEAMNLYHQHNGRCQEIARAIVEPGDLGYSEKKAHMFIRDMVEWKVWPDLKEYDQLNVASDANTMRVALRTGILRTAIPLLASYLDIYSYQYELIARYCQLAWRTVWEEWGSLDASARPLAPVELDYVLYYSIGKQYCTPTAKCGKGCLFAHVCPQDLRLLNPPKSISIQGQTGWKSGRTNGGGGGGIMS